MRIMTGAILILAGSFLLGISQTGVTERWIIIYSHVLSVAGAAFLMWGTIRDLSIYSQRKKRELRERKQNNSTNQ